MARSHRNPHSTAVLARRAPAEVETDDAQAALWRTLDFFPTPPWGARAGAEQLLALDPTAKVIREPACGEMHMAGPLQAYFDVKASDVHAHAPGTPVLDWLDDAAWPDDPDCDWVMTNPPFNIAEEFVTRGLRRARRGVALLLRLSFLESTGRYHLMAGDHPLTQLSVFSERLPMALGRWDPTLRSATSYGWFFWMKDAEPRPLSFIGPGTRERLWMKDDAGLYGVRQPAALLDLMEGGDLDDS